MAEHRISKFDFASLPEDIQREILSYLADKDLFSFRTTNKQLRLWITERKMSGKMEVLYPNSLDRDNVIKLMSQFDLIRPPLILRRLTLRGNNQKLYRFFPQIPPSVESLAFVDVTFEVGGFSRLPTGLLDLDLSRARYLHSNDISSLPSSLTSLKAHLSNKYHYSSSSFPCQNIVSMDLTNLACIPETWLPQFHRLTELKVADSRCRFYELTSLKKLVISDMDAKYWDLPQLPQNLVYFSYSPYKR
eukprot:TRINITY_DN4190_c0_g1_i2.p1 TRINITY_DN4190_c0_g1~~TRINITY_DN4190_c0_g1_i2.p1  ORF type:complete len:268 (-),score=1.16 TRINITY_DN4190_c0_g1_i2:47-787(-)